ncbi:MAG: hypothetical protein MZU91_14075 [Desulfosudis oleivorans]|nr:hypothetical protein [Desulfosudis oleivorans]
MTIAFFGAEASFTHLAARLHFGDSSRYFPQPRIDRVFDEVEKGSVDWGVVPVENSLEGSVNITLDRLITTLAENQGGNFSADQPVPYFFDQKYKGY